MTRRVRRWLRRSWASFRFPRRRREALQLHVQSLEPKFALAAWADTRATSVTSPAAGSYKAGDDLVFQVAFNKPVAVVGTPQLSLTIGAVTRPATYSSGSGSNRLDFRYTVRPGDTDTDGIAVARSLGLPSGSSIRNLVTRAAASAAITPPNTARVLVDTTKPAVATVTGPAADTYPAGSTLSFKVTFTEPVFVTAANRKLLTLPVTIGGATRAAAWNGEGSGTTSLTFTTVTRPGDSAPSGLRTVGAIGLSNGAALRDRAGNAVVPAVSAQFPNAKVSGVAPSPLAVERLKAQGIVADPDVALSMLPAANPDAAPQPAPATAQTIPVATLQSNYETVFGGLSAQLGVTLSTRQNVDKIDFLKGQAAAGHFDLLAKPIQNNPAGVTAVAFQPVRYQTDVDLPAGSRSFQVSGGLIMPQGIDKTKLKGVVTYFHGTTFDKSTVPSNYTPEMQLTAELFASQGYIVVAPDYIGQGVDWQNVHPYVLYPQVSAKTAIDMLAAVKPLIAAQYQLTADDPALKLFSVGYSEGGAYSLWFNSVISGTPGVLDPFYALTHSVGLEGAYNTSNVIKNFLFSDVGKGQSNPFNIQSLALTNFAKPLLSADALLSFATYGMGGDYAKAFSRNYLQLNASPPVSQSLCNVNGAQVGIPQAFAQPNGSSATPVFFAALNKRANGASYLFPIVADPTTVLGRVDLVKQLGTSTKNNMYALMDDYLLVTEKGRMLLDQALAAADVNLTPCANAGVSIISLANDSVVTPNNYAALLAAYPGKIANAISLNENDFMVVSGVSKEIDWPLWVPTDHMQAATYEFIYALNIFNTYAANP